MELFGYARVSTDDQDLTLQIAALREAGCNTIRSEKRTGTKREGRTELQDLMAFLREGDTLLVTRIDRLARSLRDLQNISHDLRNRGVTLRALHQPIDTGTAAGNAFFGMLGVFAEFETSIRAERQAEGIAKAKGRGAYKGRKRSIDLAEVKRLRDEAKLGPSAIAKELGIGRASVYRLLADGASKSAG